MFAITARIRESRRDGKPGTIVFVISNGSTGRCVSTGIQSTRERLHTLDKHIAVRGLHRLHSIIENLSVQDKSCDIDEVARLFRQELASGFFGAGRKFDCRKRISVRHDLVSIGRPFRDAFAYCPEQISSIKGSQSSVGTLMVYISAKIEDLRHSGQISTSRNYRSTQKALARYADTVLDCDLNLDASFVAGFYSWLKRQDMSESTESFYLRTFKAILGKASADGLLSVENSWFDNLPSYKYLQQDSHPVYVMDKAMLSRLASMNLGGDPKLELARDLFMFCFYCRGLELVDALHLRHDNIVNGALVFNRRLNGRQQTVKLEPPARRILEKYIDNNGEYIFPVILENDGRYYASVRTSIAADLNRLGKLMGLPVSLTFSMSRKSWIALSRESNLSALMMS